MTRKKENKNKKEPGFKRFEKIVNFKLNSVSMVLRGHLLAEYYIDQFIAIEIARGDIILDKGFSFSQKLTIFKSLDIAESRVVDALSALNGLRNRCAHDMEYRISETDIDRIGLPQGRDYLEDKDKFSTEKDKKQLLYLRNWGRGSKMDIEPLIYLLNIL